MLTRAGEALLGRRHERDVLDALLAAALAGQSGVVVIVGEPGIGKTALLEYAIGSRAANTNTIPSASSRRATNANVCAEA